MCSRIFINLINVRYHFGVSLISVIKMFELYNIWQCSFMKMYWALVPNICTSNEHFLA
jgi:hypothetical protein